jgi:ADP-heptose:LPS heptosyltransferase
MEKILVVRTDRLGDVILTLPVLSRLRSCFPRAYIAMLLRRYTGALVEGNPFADELIWYADEHDREVPFVEMLATLRQKKFDAAVLVHPTLRIAWLMVRAGIPVRIGTGYRAYSFLLNRRVFEHRKDALRHEAEYNLNLLSPLGCEPPDPAGGLEFPLVVPPAAALKAELLLKSLGIHSRFVVIHPGSGGSAREWPLENFGLLGSRLAAEIQCALVVTGSAGEEQLARSLATMIGTEAKNVAGQLTLQELTALIRSASLFVSHSTGPLHIAAAVGTPVVGLYPQLTAMSPRRWGPYTKKARVLVPDKPADCTDCRGKTPVRCACMASISVDAVFQAAREIYEDPSTDNRRV